jgi:hypothetical protein
MYERETPKHVTIFCPRYHNSRGQLRTNGRLNFKRAPHNGGGGKKGYQVVAVEKDLEQFRLAEELIEN